MSQEPMLQDSITDVSNAPEILTEKPSGSWWRFLGMCTLGALIFGCGIIVGGAGTIKFIEKKLKAHMEHPEEAPDKILPVIAKNLKLSPEQITKIDPVIRKHHAELMQIREEMSPRIAREFKAIEDDVNAVLDPEQQKKWHGWFDKVRWFWLPRVQDLNKNLPDKK
jgi:hypothetical protein